MASKDTYSAFAKKIVKELNENKLAFKTYNVEELNKRLGEEGGSGSRLNTAATAKEFSLILMELGFVIYPSIDNTLDGYVRIYRAASLIGNILQSIKYPGPDGDEYLSKLLTQVKLSNSRP